MLEHVSVTKNKILKFSTGVTLEDIIWLSEINQMNKDKNKNCMTSLSCGIRIVQPIREVGHKMVVTRI